MATTVYVLSILTSGACSAMLIRAFRRSGLRFLLWSSICFGGLALGSIMLLVDLRFMPEVDLLVPRLVIHLVAISCLIVGFILDTP